ncbi:MAG: lecithin retinol acyltransferase family protein [Ruminococcus sp.]|nr:lecithin retinol acyltransferase family protein [Ruminococcus sp.]
MFKSKSIEDLPEKWDYCSFEKGAQLRVKRSFYYHHGIFTGESVIHFGEGNSEQDISSPANNRVTECSLQDFLQGGVPEVRVYSRKEKRFLKTPDEIVKTAKEALGSGGYDFYSNNCEHFSNYCAFGVAFCNQGKQNSY